MTSQPTNKKAFANLKEIHNLFRPEQKKGKNIVTPINPKKQYIDIDKIRFARHNPELFISSEREDKGHEQQKEDIVSKCTNILKVYRENSKKEQYLWVSYAEKEDKNFIGRILGTAYSDRNKHARHISLLEIPRPLRNWLSHKNYVDLDIKNCHPCLIASIGRWMGNPMEGIHKYIDDRETQIQEIQNEFNVSHDSAKQFFIQVCYNGGYRPGEWFTDRGIQDTGFEPSCFKGKHNICSDIRFVKDILLNNIFVEECKYITTRHDKSNDNGRGRNRSLFSHLIQQFEKQIILRIATICEDEYNLNIKSCVFCHDGIMIPYDATMRSLYKDKPQRFLEQLHQAIKNEFHMDVSFDFKPLVYDPSLDEKFEEFREKLTDDPEELGYLTWTNTKEAGEQVAHYWRHRLVSSQGVLYIRQNQIWHEVHGKGYDLLLRAWVQDTPLLKTKDKQGDEGDETAHLHTTTTDNIVKELRTQLAKRDDGGIFREKIRYSSLGYWAFEKGVVYIPTGEFYEWDDPHFPDIYLCTCRLANNYNIHTAEQKEFIHHHFFRNIFGEDEWYYRNQMARAMAGCLDRDWVSNQGERSTGKSKNTDMAKHSFGSDYVVNGDWRDLVHNKGGDVQRKMAWVKRLEHARICIMDESPNEVIDGNMLKRITNNVEIPIRRLYSEIEDVIPQARLFSISNDLPSADPPDAFETSWPFTLRYEFVDNPTQPWEKQKIPTNVIDDIIRDPYYQSAYISLIFEAYTSKKVNKPSHIQENVRESKGEEGDIGARLRKFFHITNHPHDKVPVKEVKNALVGTRHDPGINMTPQRINRNLEIKFGLRRSTKRTHWIGLREKSEQEEEDEIDE